MQYSYVVSATICFAFPNLVTSRSCGETDNQGGPVPVSLNTNLPPEPQPADVKQGKRCCPYSFNGRICKVLDDRVLCGYNRNVGRPLSKDNEVPLGADCRLRGGRLECGYLNGPFTNPRRPPPSYNGGADIDEFSEDKNEVSLTDDKEAIEEMVTPKKQKLMAAVTNKPQPKGVTRCVEIGERIVCRNM